MTTITEEEAKNKDYRALTTSYRLPTEKWMLDNVLNDMARGNMDVVLVADPKKNNHVEVWRRAPSQ
jgi:hypothetical protein